MAPPSPKARDQSLPPILRRTHPSSRLGCSKGARGLSVLMRETGIFTGTTDSQCPSLRQCPDRCAIRAGRNLPDKEFRYLRTVIVTAAVYRGFSLELRPEGLTPLFNLPAPGRRQALYVVLLTLQSPMFLVNSRLGQFTAAPFRSSRKGFHVSRAHLLPKLRCYFAEFLHKGSLKRLWILTSPTCVRLRYGHPKFSLEVFLGSVGSTTSSKRGLVITPQS